MVAVIILCYVGGFQCHCIRVGWLQFFFKKAIFHCLCVDAGECLNDWIPYRIITALHKAQLLTDTAFPPTHVVFVLPSELNIVWPTYLS